MLIGRKGGHMRGIFGATNAKLRIRGRGSGHLEVDGRMEAPVPLMVAVTSNKNNPEAFRKAVEQILALLQEVGHLFCTFCDQRGLHQPTSTEPIASFGEVSRASETIITDLLALWPHPSGARAFKKVTPGGIVPPCREVLQHVEVKDAVKGSDETALLFANGRPKRIRTRAKHHRATSPAAEPDPAADHPHPQEDNLAVVITHKQDPQHQHLLPPQFHSQQQWCDANLVVCADPFSSIHPWNLAGYSEVPTGCNGESPTGYISTLFADMYATYGGDYSYTHLAADYSAAIGGDMYIPTAYDGRYCSSAHGFGYGGSTCEGSGDAVANLATACSYQRHTALSETMALGTWTAHSNGTEPNSLWGRTDNRIPVAPIILLDTAVPGAAIPSDNKHVISGLSSPSTVWQNRGSSKAMFAGLLGLPAVPRNGVVGLSRVAGADSLSGTHVPAFVTRAEAADGGHSSTESEDDLGRAVTTIMNEFYDGQADTLTVLS